MHWGFEASFRKETVIPSSWALSRGNKRHRGTGRSLLIHLVDRGHIWQEGTCHQRALGNPGESPPGMGCGWTCVLSSLSLARQDGAEENQAGAAAQRGLSHGRQAREEGGCRRIGSPGLHLQARGPVERLSHSRCTCFLEIAQLL